MSDLPAHASAPDGGALHPSLIGAFSPEGTRGAQRRRIPRGGMMLGRDQDGLDAPADDPRMSLRHAQLRFDGSRLLIRDLESEHGTRVNGQALLGERVLQPGDVLRLGDTLMVYAMASSAPAMDDPTLIGSSVAMEGVRRSIKLVAARKHSVVISGETGTGKEVVARLLHERSGRSGPFLAVNCGTFTEGLLASDLFGHVRGAFTGAVSEQQGLFRAANGGTLLLDEIAELPLPMQSNLLRVLEMNEVRPVGGTRLVAVDVRVIATCNRELIDLVQSGLFRADLYSRLAQWSIRLLPLRARREDIEALTTELLTRCDGAGRTVAPDLAEALLLHDWPLNVRGLFNVLSVAVITCPGEEPLVLNAEVRLALWSTRSLGPTVAQGEPLVLGEPELIELMKRFRGKVTKVAQHLGVTRPKLYRMLAEHELEPATFRVP